MMIVFLGGDNVTKNTPSFVALIDSLPDPVPLCRAARLLALFLRVARRSGQQLSFNLWLIVENYVQQGTVDFNVAVVINETQFPKLVHEKTHARACRADHFRQCLLAYFRNDRLGPTFFAKIRQEQKDPR